MVAVGAANTSKSFFEIAALEKGSHRAVDDGSPEAVLVLIALVVDLPEGLKMLIHQTPQIGGTRIAWAVQWQRFGAPKIHDQAAHPGAAAHGTPFGQAADKPSCGGSSATGQQKDMYITTVLLRTHSRWCCAPSGPQMVAAVWVMS